MVAKPLDEGVHPPHARMGNGDHDGRLLGGRSVHEEGPCRRHWSPARDLLLQPGHPGEGHGVQVGAARLGRALVHHGWCLRRDPHQGHRCGRAHRLQHRGLSRGWQQPDQVLRGTVPRLVHSRDDLRGMPRSVRPHRAALLSSLRAGPPFVLEIIFSFHIQIVS